jgi:putative thioredoxin
MTAMTQQPFSRHGAVDLSGLQQRPAASPAAAGAPGGASHAYALDVTEENFQSVLESSLTAPVLLAFYSPSRLPESADMVDDLRAVADEFGGRFLVGAVDVDAAPAIAQAVQLQSIPFVYAVIDGRPQPLLQDVLSLEELRTTLTQVVQSLTAQGIAGRHAPIAAPAAEGEEPVADPRYAAAEDALASGDVDGAVAEYQKLVDANPADTEAAAGLAMAKVVQRTLGADPVAVRAAAEADPGDVEAQLLAADLDLVDGDPEGAFARLVETVRRTSDADRGKAREHLLALFNAVGGDDPRVLKARQALASALF